MANEVRVHASVKDDVSQPLTSIRQKLGNIGQEAKSGVLAGVGLGAGIAVFGAVEAAVGGVVNVFGESIKKAEENQASYSRLTASLKANVAGWDGNIAAIQQANEAGAKLGFTDIEMADSLAGLVGATHDVAKAQADMAIAQDLARFKGISLEEATAALTKVEGGRYRLLAGLGIVLEKGATQTEALAAVQKVAGGQALAYANTTAGAQAKLNATWEATQEKIGTALLPVLTSLANFLSDNLPSAIQGAEDAFHSLQPVFDVIAKGLGFLGDATRLAAFTFETLQKNAEDALGPLARLNDLVGSAPVPWHEASKAAIDFSKDVSESARSAYLAAPVLADAGAVGAKGYARGLSSGLKQIDSTAEVLVNAVRTRLHNTVVATQAGADAAKGYADGLRGGYDDVQNAAKDLVAALKNPISGTKRITYLEGVLSSKALAQGLRSSDPLIRADAKALRARVEAELAKLREATAQYGRQAGINFAAGLTNAQGIVSKAAWALAAKAAAALKMQSPAKEGPFSEAGGPEGWGKKAGALFGKGLGVTLPDVGAMLGTMPGLAAMAPALATAGSGGSILHVRVEVVGGVMSPGDARALGDRLGPTIAAAFQRQGLLPRFGSAQRG